MRVAGNGDVSFGTNGYWVNTAPQDGIITACSGISIITYTLKKFLGRVEFVFYAKKTDNSIFSAAIPLFNIPAGFRGMEYRAVALSGATVITGHSNCAANGVFIGSQFNFEPVSANCVEVYGYLSYMPVS